jgi:hypothetical protein
MIDAWQALVRQTTVSGPSARSISCYQLSDWFPPSPLLHGRPKIPIF